MPVAHQYSRRALFAFAFLGFALAAAALYAWASFDGIPPRHLLAPASGKVEWVKPEKYAVRFKFSGEPKLFSYASKGNAVDQVRNALSQNSPPVVTVLYDPTDSHGPVYSSETYYSVYEISLHDKAVRTHAQVASAWASDTAIAPWLAAVFAVIACFLLFTASRSAT
jgi:hypothetical protein